MNDVIKIGTRGSKLALYQAELVSRQLKTRSSEVQCEIVKIQTKGDRDQSSAINSMGPGIFTREIEEALLKGQVDVAVHSAKDLAAELPSGLMLGGILEREDIRDCLVTRDSATLGELPNGARIGTSSLRRRAQLRRLKPDIKFVDLRGNVDTRIRKIQEGKCDAMVLAHAGLKRLALTQHVAEVFDPSVFLPQVGQGAIALEVRSDDQKTADIVKALNHELTSRTVLAERSFLARLQGGCQLPVGIVTTCDGKRLEIKGAVFALDGSEAVRGEVSGTTSEAQRLGTQLADEILKSGGREILSSVRDVPRA